MKMLSQILALQETISRLSMRHLILHKPSSTEPLAGYLLTGGKGVLLQNSPLKLLRAQPLKHRGSYRYFETSALQQSCLLIYQGMERNGRTPSAQ